MPKIEVVSLGGTITMTSATSSSGAVPSLTADELLGSVPELVDVADLSVTQFRLMPGAHLSVDDVIDLARHVESSVSQGAGGVVVIQGTDTIEEVAFGLERLLDIEQPVVVTGAMRHANQVGADGPANVLAAVRLAAADAARGMGVMVALNDEIHAAELVTKAHTSHPGAFSTPTGTLGWMVEGRPVFVGRPHRRVRPVPRPVETNSTAVCLYRVSLGDDGRLLSHVVDAGFGGLVLEAMGGGHVPAELVPRLETIAAAMPTVLTSRVGTGPTLERTYAFAGSETDLLGKGLISGGCLSGPKARILLTLLLRAGVPSDQLARWFAD